MRQILRLMAFVVAMFWAIEPLALAQPTTAPAPEAPAPAPAPASPAAVRTAPAQVKIGMYINDIQSIDLHSYSFVADVYVWFIDSDPEITPGASFEWMNMFAPDDHVQTAIYEEPVVQADGSQYQVFRHQGPFAAKFSVKTYPFDAHNLTIEIEDQEFNADDLVYVADKVTMNPAIDLPGFEIGTPTLKAETRAYPTNFGDPSMTQPESYSRAVVSIPISRPVTSGVTKSLLPVFIVVLVAAAALLLKPEHIEARVGLSITALLTLVALQFSAQASLPDVGYLLMLDQVYLASYAFVLLVVLLLVMAPHDTPEDGQDVTRRLAHGGPTTALLSILLYSAVIALMLWLNLSSPET
jgi:hypothetical protein